MNIWNAAHWALHCLMAGSYESEMAEIQALHEGSAATSIREDTYISEEEKAEMSWSEAMARSEVRRLTGGRR